MSNTSPAAKLDRRLVVLVDSRRLEGLRAIARREQLSVGAVIRQLVRERLDGEAEAVRQF